MRMWCDVPSAQAAGVPADRVMGLEEAERYDFYLRSFDLICGRCFSDWRRHAGLDAIEIETEVESSDWQIVDDFHPNSNGPLQHSPRRIHVMPAMPARQHDGCGLVFRLTPDARP